MESDKLFSYFRYVRGKIDALLNNPAAGFQDVAALRSELRLFRERASSLEYLSPELRQLMATVNLNVADTHLSGSRENMMRTWWMYVIPWGRVFLGARRAKDKALLDGELSRLRDEFHDLYRAAEATLKKEEK